MQERNVIGSAAAVAVAPFVDFFQALTPFIAIAIVLIITDSRFGIEAAQKEVRPSEHPGCGAGQLTSW